MAFHEVRFPDTLSVGSTGGPMRRTEIVTLANGYEKRNTNWADSRRSYDAGIGLSSLDDLQAVVAFFEARRGQLHAFRWKDWLDWKSCAPSDEVSADAGTLNSWDITVYPAASDAPAPSAQPAQGTSDPALAIPDDDEFFGVTDVIDLGGYGTVDRMVVDVALTHQVSSDLRIELRSPLGRTVVLSDAEAGLATAGRIALSLDSSAPGSPLAALVGEPVAGPWQLRVYDTVIIDTGTMDGWDITVNG